ncbi:MAG: hypothetical protein QXI84_03685 [Thermofilaceae archaeon]
MVEAVVEARREVSLDRLEVLVRRANELKANLGALVSAIESKYSSDPRLGSLISNVLKAVKPPEPPDEQLFSVASSLERYVGELERSVKLLTEYAVTLDKLQEELGKLEREAEELMAWSELLREIAPHLANDASRLAMRAQRLIFQPPLEDLRRALDEVDFLLREAKSHNRVCRTAYVNRVNELLGTASQLIKAVKRAHAGSALTEASKLLAFEEALKEVMKKLTEAARQPLAAKIDLAKIKLDLGNIEREVSLILEQVFNEVDRDLTREIERLARSLNGRPIALSTLLETLSKRVNLPVEAITLQLVSLEKRGFVTIQVKLET